MYQPGPTRATCYAPPGANMERSAAQAFAARAWELITVGPNGTQCWGLVKNREICFRRDIYYSYGKVGRVGLKTYQAYVTRESKHNEEHRKPPG